MFFHFGQFNWSRNCGRTCIHPGRPKLRQLEPKEQRQHPLNHPHEDYSKHRYQHSRKILLRLPSSKDFFEFLVRNHKKNMKIELTFDQRPGQTHSFSLTQMPPPVPQWPTGQFGVIQSSPLYPEK